MQEARIVFMGTPEFAVGVLRKMVEAGKNVVGVVTAPDRPAGRGRRLKSSAVKEYALAQGLPLLQPTNLKDPSFLESLQALGAQIQVVVAFRMLPRQVWQMPPMGTFNLHASLLPQYRGAAPINWAIINQEKKTGVTTFFIDEKIDTGAIIAQSEIAIDPEETAQTLHDKLMAEGSQLVLHTLDLIERGEATPQPQTNPDTLSGAPKLTAENTRIDWTLPGTRIAAFIRGLSPYPAAWSLLLNNGEEKKVKIYAASFRPDKHQFRPGTITATKKEMRVACEDGYLSITEIQLPGKRPMHISALLNGYSFGTGAKLT